ncbi:MAG TPA: bifunctional precorrin-2 dehydrogenase/sirohydrochlorin ferrochelatase [Acidimicrobiales bacterium]|jgi:siroheme synthase-like protein|nr:bifunctional precorrin-2 dehydrogenase/sirohydrochlorin ferrochelatase [Acidimicrobiales bacterium]
MLPLALKLDGLDVLVVGAGVIGVRKAAQLIDAGARVSVIAEEVRVTLPEGVANVAERRYRPGDLAGCFLVVSATGDPVTNDLIVAEAADARIWLNVVDDPGRSSFYFMALHRQGDVTVAVSTSGAAPALAQAVRSLVAERLPDNLDEVAATLRDERQALHERGATTENLDWPARIRELLAE